MKKRRKEKKKIILIRKILVSKNQTYKSNYFKKIIRQTIQIQKISIMQKNVKDQVKMKVSKKVH